MIGAIPLVAALAFVAGCGGGDGEDAAAGSGEIAFTVNDTGWNEIWLMEPDGSERRRLTEVEPPENDAAGNMSPAWSPDGTQIAFAAQIGTREEHQRLTEIYLMRGDGTDKRSSRRTRRSMGCRPGHRTGSTSRLPESPIRGRKRRAAASSSSTSRAVAKRRSPRRVAELRPKPGLVARRIGDRLHPGGAEGGFGQPESRPTSSRPRETV